MLSLGLLSLQDLQASIWVESLPGRTFMIRLHLCQSFCKSTDKYRTRIFCTTMMLYMLDATHAGSQTSLAIPSTSPQNPYFVQFRSEHTEQRQIEHAINLIHT